MTYDVAIIGGGATGAATAWRLSHFRLRTVLLEKECDVGFGVSKANSGIVHAGFHHEPETLKAKLEVRGNIRFGELARELHFPFERCGIVVAAFSPAELDACRTLYRRGVANGLTDLELCDGDRLRELEPKVNPETVGGLFAPGGGVVEPYSYVFALAESARLNGVELRTGFRLDAGRFENGLWRLRGASGEEIEARCAVNAAGLFADEVSRRCGAEEFTIRARKGEEYLLDRECPARPARVVFPAPSEHTKGILVIPTAGGTTMVGPSADWTENKQDESTSAEQCEKIMRQAAHLVPGISSRDLITSFAGLRPVLEATEDFYLALSKRVPNFVQAAGIQSPGLTASPAVGEYITELIRQSGLLLQPKETPRRELPARHITRNTTPEELDRLHSRNPGWTDLICRCEKISEAEIVEAIRHGHTTLDGVKFYTRAGMGRCQGGFCGTRIMEIIARETGLPPAELTKRGAGTALSPGKLGDLTVKEFSS